MSGLASRDFDNHDTPKPLRNAQAELIKPHTSFSPIQRTLPWHWQRFLSDYNLLGSYNDNYCTNTSIHAHYDMPQAGLTI